MTKTLGDWGKKAQSQGHRLWKLGKWQNQTHLLQKLGKPLYPASSISLVSQVARCGAVSFSLAPSNT